ncbi:AfsR/SARP family transcriptional regulator [Roseiflexus sp.]|uniref:AfsR/SARP family transcriptional regulator n=1 Tax=Roseiflexus sp. TaxID=2562120 RepID=UPI00398B2B36
MISAPAKIETNIVDLCTPLLLHPDEMVQRQAALVLMTTLGTRVFTLLRRRLSDSDARIQCEAKQALRSLERHSGQPVDYRPFRGIHIECLGVFRVYISNHELFPQDWAQTNSSRAGARKVQSVLAYLMHCGNRGASPEELLAVVWENNGNHSALARTLSALRRTIERLGGVELAESALLYTGDRYILSPAVYTSDVHMFIQSIRVAEETENEHDLATAVPMYRNACALYSGNYMATVGITADDVDERRTDLLNGFLNALERQAEHAWREGDDERCITLCRTGLKFDPSDEHLTLWLLRCLARQRRNHEIVRAYFRYLRSSGVSPDDDDDPVVRWMHAYR